MLNNEVLVSVIIPTYGRAKTLKRAIESVIAQTYSNIELIVVDDNNPGTEYRKKTEELMNNYCDSGKIEYIKHEYNRNGAAARNTGFFVSKGKYICFLDDDDYFYPDKIKEQVIFLDNRSEYDAVYCGWSKKGKEYTQNFKGNLTEELLLMKYQPITPTIMFSRSSLESIKGFDESFLRHQDYELMIRFFYEHRITFIDKCLVGLGENDGENVLLGQELEKLKSDFLEKFSNTIDQLEKVKSGTKKKIISKHYARVFLSHLNHKYYSLALRLFFSQMFKHPLRFIYEVGKTTIILLNK